MPIAKLRTNSDVYKLEDLENYTKRHLCYAWLLNPLMVVSSALVLYGLNQGQNSPVDLWPAFIAFCASLLASHYSVCQLLTAAVVAPSLANGSHTKKGASDESV